MLPRSNSSSLEEMKRMFSHPLRDQDVLQGVDPAAGLFDFVGDQFDGFFSLGQLDQALQDFFELDDGLVELYHGTGSG